MTEVEGTSSMPGGGVKIVNVIQFGGLHRPSLIYNKPSVPRQDINDLKVS